MAHAKLQDHQTSGSEEEEFYRLRNICAGRPSWSCDLDHLYKVLPPPPPSSSQCVSISNLASTGQAVLEKNMFENNCHIHVYRPGTGTHNLLLSKYFHKHIFLSIGHFAAS